MGGSKDNNVRENGYHRKDYRRWSDEGDKIQQKKGFVVLWSFFVVTEEGIMVAGGTNITTVGQQSTTANVTILAG